MKNEQRKELKRNKMKTKIYRNGTERRRQRAKTILKNRHIAEYKTILENLIKKERSTC
jgi:hypothetical protein